MFNKNVILISFLLLSILNLNCDKNVVEPDIKEPYINLKVGNLWQYYVPVDDMYMVHEITGLKTRTDGLLVHEMKTLDYTKNGIYTGYIYFYIQDNYLMLTHIDTIYNGDYNPNNKFNEVKVTSIYPQEVTSFYDTDSSYVTIEMIDSLNLNNLTFYNVAENTFQDSSLLFKTYYAKNIGLVQSIIGNIKVILKYSKIEDKEIGEFITPVNKTLINRKKIPLNLYRLIK